MNHRTASLSRYFPLFFTAALIILSPICFAHAVEVQLPPAVDYLSNLRDDEREKAQTPTALPAALSTEQRTCETCSRWQAQALTKLLARYKELAQAGGWPTFKTGKTLHTGATDARIPTLRQELTIMGDYQPASGIPATSQEYDAVLTQAVIHFQERHGINGDGKLGKATQALLAQSVETRIAQIMATLVRIENKPLPEENKFILVNVPAYTLTGVVNQTPALSMRVIVGARANPTPLFDNEITDVAFNPAWHVPVRIARNEMLPKLRKNPSYFIKAGFVVTQDGVEVDPMTINPDSEDLSFRQRAGDRNALGKIKFNLPNNNDIYLHSTALPKLFATDDRALSHGCVRLEKPRELAYFVMENETGWDRTKIDASYDASREHSVKVSHVPVHLVYWTAFVDAKGEAHFYNDVYKKDSAAAVEAFNHAPASNQIVVASK